MKTSDGNITHADIRELRRDTAVDGWGDIALDIFDREPVLAPAVANRWAKIRAMLLSLGLTEEQSGPILQQVCRLTVEGVGVVQRSSRRLWDDLHPGAEDEAN